MHFYISFCIAIFIVFFAVLFFGIVINMVLTVKFRHYLHKFHYEKWEYLTTFGKNTGPGLYNTLRFFSFILDSDNLGDPEVKIFKDKLKRIHLYLFLGMGGWMAISKLFFLIILFLAVVSNTQAT